MNILLLGDVVGKPGRRALFARLAALRERHAIDFVVVNAENAAGGFGLTSSVMASFFAQGVDVLTSGNHIWDKREIFDFIDAEPRLLRPHNYPDHTAGRGWTVVTAANGVEVGVLNLMGQVFMAPALACPFQCASALLDGLTDPPPVILVDFHAETTSEKMALGWHLDGRVAALVGTHTHVPTADERVLPGGTAYISDLGMTGCTDSVIGMNRAKVLRRFVDKLPQRLEVADGPATVCGVVVTVDPVSGRSTAIARIAEPE